MIQGFGNVGSHAAKFMSESEFKIVAISDITGGYYNPAGLDIPAALHYIIENGNLEGFDQADQMSNEELLELDCDLLIPAALGGVITNDNVTGSKPSTLSKVPTVRSMPTPMKSCLIEVSPCCRIFWPTPAA